jgi:prolyl-tRNA synthetase
MIRAGLIRKLIAGAYSYLPLGFRVLKKVEEIVREEMDKAGAHEILMPAIQPADLWHETGRYELLGEELVKFKDRSGKEMVIGPTHEEVVTDIARNELHSYKDLPKIIYQIQTKLRDEPRPRFGVIRSKEFIMKDAYSFDRDQQGLDISYKKMYNCYHSIFKRCGLDVISVEADTGFMGGSESAEFMVLSDSGEDIVVTCSACDYKSSLTKAACKLQKDKIAKKTDQPSIKEVSTPNVTTIEKVARLLDCKPQQMIKTLIYLSDNEPTAVLIRGDYEVNETKLAVVLKAKRLSLADEKIIEEVTGAPLGFSGPCGLKGIKIIADHSVAEVEDGVTGANKKDKHLIHVAPNRDFSIKEMFDIRYIIDGEPCPKCEKPIALKRAIELGHIFKLGIKYSDSMRALFLDTDGSQRPFVMGCYGIGINRIIAAVIEQNNDGEGISWPISIAPYKVIIISLNMDDEKVVEASEDIYSQLCDDKIETIFDDRNVSPGVKFKDANLIGIPLQIVVGSRNMAKALVELRVRASNEKKEVAISKVSDELKKLLDKVIVL